MATLKPSQLDLFAKTVNNIAFLPVGANAGVYVPGQTYSGWFIGAGTEYALNFLPGLFWKTEYRFSELDTVTKRTYFTVGVYTAVDEDSNTKFKRFAARSSIDSTGRCSVLRNFSCEV